MNIEPTLEDSSEYAELVKRINLAVDQLPHSAVRMASWRRLALLEHAARERAAAIELVARLVDECANDVKAWNSPTEWSMVGAAIGVTAQGASQAHKRWKAAQK